MFFKMATFVELLNLRAQKVESSITQNVFIFVLFFLLISSDIKKYF